MNSIKFTLCTLLVLLNSEFVFASDHYSCPGLQPDFQQEVFESYHGKNVAVVGAHLQLLDYLEKPYPAENVASWIQAYQIDNFCVRGSENEKQINADTKGVVIVPSEFSNTGEQQILIFSSIFSMDPDRGRANPNHGNNTILDLTMSFSED